MTDLRRNHVGRASIAPATSTAAAATAAAGEIGKFGLTVITPKREWELILKVVVWLVPVILSAVVLLDPLMLLAVVLLLVAASLDPLMLLVAVSWVLVVPLLAALLEE